MAQVDEVEVLDGLGVQKTVPTVKPLTERIGALTSPAAGSVNGQLATMVASLSDVSTKLTALQGYVDGLEGYSDGMEGLVGATNSALTTTNTALSVLQGYVDTLEALIGTTNSTLTTVDGRVDGLEALIGTTNTTLATVSATLTSLAGYLDTVESLITTTNATLTTVDGRVDGLEALISTLNGYTDGIEALIGTTNGALSTLAGYMDGVEGKLDAIAALLPASLGQKTKALALAVTLASDEDLLARLGALNASAVTDPAAASASLAALLRGILTLIGEVQASPTANSVLDRLKTIATSLTTLQGYVDGLEGYNDGIEALIGTTNTALTTMQGYMDGLEGLIGTTNSALTTVQGYVDGLEALFAAATPAGENHIGQVSGPIQIVSVTPTVSSSPAYSTGDCIGGKMTFANMVRANDVKALIQQVVIHCKSAQTIACDLLLFNADPSSSTFTDNAALAVNAADFDKLIGVVSLATTDWVNLGTPSMGQKDNIAKPFQPVSGGTTIYGVLVARGTPTLGSTSDIKVTLKAI